MPHGKFFCNYRGCIKTNQPSCRRLCRAHFKTVMDGKDQPAPYPLVLPKDRQLISEVLYLALEQMSPCILSTEKPKYATAGHSCLREGYRGLACKHCKDSKNLGGRWYPTSETAMYCSTFAKNIVKHLQNCPHCPSEVRCLFSLSSELFIEIQLLIDFPSTSCVHR